MRYLSFALIFIAFNLCTAQIGIPPSSDYREEIDSANTLALRFAQKENIPGMEISVSKYGGILWSKGYGYANLDKKKTVSTSKTQFRIASISKSLTALALAKLVDEGKLDFDESIYTYLPNYPKKKYDFTVRQVAGHIAGIRHYKGSEFILNKKMSISEGLDVFKNDSLMFKPGTDYKYSTYGWNLLSEVVQETANETFRSYMEKSVFRPLRMDNTVLETSDTVLPNKTQFYRKTNSGDIVLGPEVNNEFKAAGGGFLSTSEDLIRFGNEIINPTIINPETVAELVKSLKTSEGKTTNYGIGFVTDVSLKNTPRYSHSGGGIGATSLILMYPKEKVVIVILTNLSNAKIKDFGNQLEAIFLN